MIGAQKAWAQVLGVRRESRVSRPRLQCRCPVLLSNIRSMCPISVQVAAVEFADGAAMRLRDCWDCVASRSMYDSFEDFRELVVQVWVG
jgi:hypothetical protein